MMFGKWMDSQYLGHENYMNTGNILKDVIKNDYLCKLYIHLVTMRGLFTHFFCDENLFYEVTKENTIPIKNDSFMLKNSKNLIKVHIFTKSGSTFCKNTCILPKFVIYWFPKGEVYEKKNRV